MTVYAVCPQCDDECYGYLAPIRIFKDKEIASLYAREYYDSEDVFCVIKTYELE